ncbi:hypothetical protein [Rhizobium mesosinicum]|uniref:Uncharacterized protein n=1 Tax=Rhizobium mesosinicum TaxID=335017 RepID=A0ABS7GV28_9HYPH|nr:hypothetical protein [Rhizobium mesosinicum]MBW9053804.1 hypothetical protein [Rhizobium mesosinicum]
MRRLQRQTLRPPLDQQRQRRAVASQERKTLIEASEIMLKLAYAHPEDGAQSGEE